jgi:C-terminal processing protease CtpA/Prc
MEPLGLGISGGVGIQPGNVPIFITNVRPDGAAARNGQLRAGDAILEINGHSLDGLSHVNAVEILKNSLGVVEMKIARETGPVPASPQGTQYSARPIAPTPDPR